MNSFISQLLAFKSSFLNELKFKPGAGENLCLHTVLPILLIFFYPLQAQAITTRLVPQPDPNFTVEQIAQGLGVPWGMAFLNQRELIFTERNGKVKILNLDNLKITSLQGAAEVVLYWQSSRVAVL